MAYLIKSTVIAARRLEVGSEVEAEDLGTEEQIERLMALGAIEDAEGWVTTDELPELDDALRAAMIGAVNNLADDDFSKDGKPMIRALEKALPNHADRITAAARDVIWEEMKTTADAAT